MSHLHLLLRFLFLTFGGRGCFFLDSQVRLNLELGLLLLLLCEPLVNPLLHSCLLGFLNLLPPLLLKIVREVVWDSLGLRDPVKVALLRHLEYLPQVAGLKSRVEEAVVSAGPLELDVPLRDESLLRRRPLSHLEDSLLMRVDELLLGWVRPHLQVVDQREVRHDLFSARHVLELDQLGLLKS